MKTTAVYSPNQSAVLIVIGARSGVTMRSFMLPEDEAIALAAAITRAIDARNLATRLTANDGAA